MPPSLTTGCIQRIVNGEEVPDAIIQILGYKKVQGSGNDRYRFLISDGVLFSPFAMLGTQMNHMVLNKDLEKFTIIQVEKCSCNSVTAEKRVIILLSVKVLVPGAQVGEKIGNPVNIVQSDSAVSSSVSSTVNDIIVPKKEPPFSVAASNSAENSFKPTTNESYRTNQMNTTYSNGSHDSNEIQNIHPVGSLTPYQNRWTVKVRVTNKSGIRTWSNSRGEGKLFSMDLLDESGEIRATAFNDSVDKYYNMIEVNKVYYISKATLKMANKQYTSIKNEYEMSFNSETTVAPCNESVASIPMLQFNFVGIQQIEQVEKDSTIDIIGICKSAMDTQKITTRATNREVTKREIRLVDTSNTEVSVTLWGTEAEKFDGSHNPVVAVKGARVSDFGGRSLSVLNSSVVQINPDIKEAHILKGWFEKEGCNIESQSISLRGGAGSGAMGGTWKTFAQASSENTGMGEKPDYYSTKATIALVRRENCMYMACINQGCNKKVIDLNNGTYRCEKCCKDLQSFKWRLMLNVSVADFTENVWVTCFQEAAEIILGVTAEELGGYKEKEEDKFNEVLADANFKSFIFKLRSKYETFNEESRLKTTVMTATPVEPLVYAKKLLNDIKQYQQVL